MNVQLATRQTDVCSCDLGVSASVGMKGEWCLSRITDIRSVLCVSLLSKPLLAYPSIIHVFQLNCFSATVRVKC